MYKVSLIILSLFMLSSCGIFSAANSCNAEYQRYKDWKKYLDEARENYNINVNADTLTEEEKQAIEADLMELQNNTNDALYNFEDCKRGYIKGNSITY